MTADRIIQPLADAAMAVWFALDRRLDRVRDWLDADRHICPDFGGDEDE